MTSIRACLIAIGAGLCFTSVMRAQTAPPVAVSPGSVTMLIGETRSFRAVDENGHFLHHVEWTVSQSGIIQVSMADEVEVTAVQAGKVILTAHTAKGAADAEVQVEGGKTLPPGTVLWSGGEIPGCRVVNITQAVPTANGPDLYEQSQCADGTYIRAFTAQGVVLWRRKIESSGHGPSEAAKSAPLPAASSLNTRAGSICDSISIGMKVEVVRGLAKARNLVAPEAEQKVWVFEEAGAECRLWLGANSDVVKKRKTLVTE